MKITKDALILAQALGGGGGITPTGNQDISTLAEYDVTDKATARVSAEERAKITADHITSGTTILGVAGSAVVPSGNQDIETLNEYDVTAKATARISATERAKIIPENIKQGETILGVEGSYSGGGGASVPLNDVNFIDYDGTIVASYSAATFANLSAMPANPTHEGLTSQGWNWSLTDAKTYVASYGMLDIGQMYITDDGKTRLYITISTEGRMNVPLRWSQSVDNGVTIDWGDNSATETVAGTGSKAAAHTYAAIGDYVITLTPTEDCAVSFGGSNATQALIPTIDNMRIYPLMLNKVELGTNVAPGYNGFANCGSLVSVTMPSNIKTTDSLFTSCTALRAFIIPTGGYHLYTKTFYSCSSLKRVSIPKIGDTSNSVLGDNIFVSCLNLKRINIPDGITTIQSDCFSQCQSLTEVIFPSSITSIASRVFQYAYAAAVYDFSHCTSVPSLSNSNAFQYSPNDCIFKIPAALYDTWKAASNWSTYASKMVAV